jgi:hypothetical protein
MFCNMSIHFSVSTSGQIFTKLDVNIMTVQTKPTPRFLIFYGPPQPQVGQDLFIFEVSRSYKTTHSCRQDSSGRGISSSQRPLPENTRHSQQTDIHAPAGIRTHNLSRRAARDLRLRPRGHWDRFSTVNNSNVQNALTFENAKRH